MLSPTLMKTSDSEALLRFCGVERSGLYHCPYREDSKPSFSIFQSRDSSGKYLWQDKSDATGKTGGNLIQLIMRIHSCDKKEAFRLAAKWDGRTPQVDLIRARGRGGTPSVTRKSTSYLKESWEKLERRPFNESKYLQQYKLDMPDWVGHDLSAYTEGPHNNLVYGTVVGSNHIRNINHFASWSCGDIQTFSICGHRDSQFITITEGIGDFLSMLAMSPTDWKQRVAPTFLHIILNSTDNTKKAIEWIQSRPIKSAAIWSALDYGTGGDSSTAAILTAFPEAVDLRPQLIPRNIEGVKDIRDAYDLLRGV